MKKPAIVFFGLMILFAPCPARIRQVNPNEFPAVQGPYLGQKPPGLKPELFAPGIVSVPEFGESNCLIWEAGNRAMFFRIDVGKLETFNLGSKWDFLKLSTLWGKSELLHCIAPDGQTMYYNYFGDLPDGSKPKRTSIFFKQKKNGDWSDGKDTQITGMWPSVDAVGNLYYTTRLKGFACIARRIQKDGTYSEQEILSFPNDEKIEFMHPCVAQDGSFIIMDAENCPHENGCELYISFCRQDNAWTKPRQMGDLIPLKNAAMARLSTDGKFIFFQAAGDIYWVSTKIIEELKSKGIK